MPPYYILTTYANEMIPARKVNGFVQVPFQGEWVYVGIIYQSNEGPMSLFDLFERFHMNKEELRRLSLAI